MFYRSGWLRCVGLMSIGIGWCLCLCVGVRFWCLWFELVVRVGVSVIYIYYILYYYYTYTLLYITIIIYYTLLFFCSVLPLFPPISSLLTPLLYHSLSQPSLSSSSFILYLSVLPYTYLYSSSFPIFLFPSQISDPACFIGVDG